MKNLYLSITLLLTGFILPLSAQVYDSQNISLLSNWFNPNEPIAVSYGIKYNGIWGWHDGNGNEYAIVGASSGTYFIDVTNPASPVQRGYVKGNHDSCIWREIKTYQNYAYIVSDDYATVSNPNPNSFQIVDLSYLPDSVHVVYDSNTLFERSHTIFIDGDKLYGGYVHGGSVGSATMAVFSLANPEIPTLIRKLNSDYSLPGGIVHDMLVRNDTIYASCGFDGLYIFKLLANNQFSLLNTLTTYVDQGYNHSSALTDDGSYLVFTDEVPSGMDIKILDVSNLSNLTVVSNFHTHPDATAHNPFIIDDLLYMAYYQDGIQVYNISNPASPVRVGFFDTYYQNPVGTYPSPPYAGAWGAYPFLPSGNLLVSDMQNGLFVLDASAISGVSTVDNNDPFSILPNPVVKGNDMLIQLNKSVSVADITITDITGKSVHNQKLTGNVLRFSTGDLSGGVYIVNILSAELNTTGKFVVTQ